jgi:hypothetical protein
MSWMATRSLRCRSWSILTFNKNKTGSFGHVEVAGPNRFLRNQPLGMAYKWGCPTTSARRGSTNISLVLGRTLGRARRRCIRALGSSRLVGICEPIGSGFSEGCGCFRARG